VGRKKKPFELTVDVEEVLRLHTEYGRYGATSIIPYAEPMYCKLTIRHQSFRTASKFIASNGYRVLVRTCPEYNAEHKTICLRGKLVAHHDCGLLIPVEDIDVVLDALCEFMASNGSELVIAADSCVGEQAETLTGDQNQQEITDDI